MNFILSCFLLGEVSRESIPIHLSESFTFRNNCPISLKILNLIDNNNVYVCVYIYIYIYTHIYIYIHFPAGKEFTCNAGDPSFIPGSGRSPGESPGESLGLQGDPTGPS